MKFDSIRKHRVRPSHVKHYNRWLAREMAISTATRDATSPHSRTDDNLQIHNETNIEYDPVMQAVYNNDMLENNPVQEAYNNAALNTGADPSEEERHHRTLIDMWTQDHTSIFKTPSVSVNSSQDAPIGIRRHREQSSNASQTETDQSAEDPPLVIDTDESSWAPFSSLEQFVGILILGSGRTMMSLLQYERVRSFVGLFNVKLPGYKSLQRCRWNLKKKYELNVSETSSPLGTPCFSLKVEQILKQVCFVPYHLGYLDSSGEFSPMLYAGTWKSLREGIPRIPPSASYCNRESKSLCAIKEVARGNGSAPAEIFAKCVCAHQTCTSVNGSPRVQIEFALVEAFNSNRLSSINVRRFSREFKDIQVNQNVYLKDVCGEEMYETAGETLNRIPLPNPWRKKAGGRIIRHVPLILYCDDLSGNVSKRWNKHMAFYFTLAGLPPKLANQEYNCHFLSTSNTAGALELADSLVDSLNRLGTDGLVAYDHHTGSEVLVIPLVLCHLGDSPMHAEVSNTMNPTSSLTPCRICNLKVRAMVDKKSEKYVSNFVGHDENGNKCSLPARDWEETIKGSKDLWSIAQRAGSFNLFDSQSAEIGLRDTLNTCFVKQVQAAYRGKSLSQAQITQLCSDLNEEFGERLFNPFLRLKGFNGHKDTPVEILHVMLLGVGKYLLQHQMKKCSAREKDSLQGRWRSFNTSGLNIPPIQPKTMIQYFQSLNGKEFRTVLQCAPFIFLECDLSDDERATWISLSKLAPYIFQTEITDINTYLDELQQHIDVFLTSIIRMSAQWANKPKFHMLVHLCDAIKRFGPAALFATENFESFNGNTRNSSVHSNHLSPGRDIANSFNNTGLMRALTAGTPLYNKLSQTYIRASASVQRIFETNLLFQRALGYNSSWNNEDEIKVERIQDDKPSNPDEIVPNAIYASFPEKDWKTLTGLSLRNKQKVQTGVFVSVKIDGQSTIARVKRVWGVGGFSVRQTRVEATQCSPGIVSDFYAMREIEETRTVIWINPEDIEGVVNVQHNCNKSKCAVEKTRPILVERQVSKGMDFEVAHVETNQFVLNSAAFYSAELHRYWAQLPIHQTTPGEWIKAIKTGICNWATSIKEKDEVNDKKRQRQKSRVLLTQTGKQAIKKRRVTPHLPFPGLPHYEAHASSSRVT
ncbi:hypothetical protein DFH28DRAFT_1131415 [Melampsora americana]|nr:hypothetical protein DFH28DRAFT_1131415 [Melampsora americana]